MLFWANREIYLSWCWNPFVFSDLVFLENFGDFLSMRTMLDRNVARWRCNSLVLLRLLKDPRKKNKKIQSREPILRVLRTDMVLNYFNVCLYWVSKVLVYDCMDPCSRPTLPTIFRLINYILMLTTFSSLLISIKSSLRLLRLKPYSVITTIWIKQRPSSQNKRDGSKLIFQIDEDLNNSFACSIELNPLKWYLLHSIRNSTETTYIMVARWSWSEQPV